MFLTSEKFIVFVVCLEDMIIVYLILTWFLSFFYWAILIVLRTIFYVDNIANIYDYFYLLVLLT